MQQCGYIVCTRHKSATPATWCIASMTHGQAYHKTSKMLVNGESGCVHAWRQKDITLNVCWTKTSTFQSQHTIQPPFSEPPTGKTRCLLVSRPFHCSYLKANKIRKSERIKKVEYAYHSWKCADAVYQKLSKLVHACRNYSFPKLARFLLHDSVHKRGLCRHAVSVCLSVCLSVCVCLSRSWILSKRINIASNFFHHRVATPF